jgi:hypothetical protein
MIIGAPVCEHGYQVGIVGGAVRHIATNGVCLGNDEVWRELRDQVAGRLPTIDEVRERRHE